MKKSEYQLFQWIYVTALIPCLLTVNIFATNPDSLRGQVFDKAGNPASDVEIFLFDTSLHVKNIKVKKFSSYAFENTHTDSKGDYTLSLQKARSGVIIGKKKDFWFRRVIIPNSTEQIVDTLKACGNLLFYLRLEKARRHDGVSVSLIGTPFSAKSGKDGAVTFSCISPGAYKAVLNAGRPGYLAVQCTLRIITAITDTFPDTLIIPFAGINNRKNLSVATSDSVQTALTVNNTTDTSTHSPNDSSPQAPKKVIKIAEKPVVNAGNDTTVGIRDEVTLQGTASIKNGVIEKWEWAIGGSPFHAHPGGTITVTSPATTRTPMVCVLRVTADNGLQAFDSVSVYAYSSPPVVTASGVSTVGIFDSIFLSGSATDNGNIVSIGWDIGNKGTFSISQNGTISLPPHRVPQDSLCCIFRAIDDDGEIGFDTHYVHVQFKWKTVEPTPSIPERKGHSLVDFNGLLWIIGGNRSDVWNSTDGMNWQKLTDAAPFGERFGHSATAFNGQLFVIAGKRTDDSYANDIWSSFDGKNWRKILEADFLRRHYHTVTNFRDRLWLIGGLGESGYEACLNDIWSSEDGTKWKLETDTALFSRRYGHGAVVHNTTFVITGGLYEDFHGTGTLWDMWQSTDGATWTCVVDSLTNSETMFHSYMAFDKRLWSIGGFCRDCSDSGRFSDVQYTVNGRDWFPLFNAAHRGSRLFSASSVFNNRLFISPSDTPFLLMLQ